MAVISGFVDGIIRGELVGWIANLDSPETLEQVVCWGEDGLSLIFKAVVPRADVAGALELVGLFGYSIPIAALAQLGSEIKVTNSQGDVLENGERIILPRLGTSYSNNMRSKTIMLHIQKTAGTSLRTALSSAYANSELLFLYPDRHTGISPEEFYDIPQAQLAYLQLIIGHIYFGLGDKIPEPVDYVTVLRHPRERLVSHYLHHLRDGTRFFQAGKNLPLALVIEAGLTDEFDNLMTRVISGTGTDVVPTDYLCEKHLDLAIYNIKTYFRFVGLAEYIDDHYPLLCQALQISTSKLTRENVGTPPGAFSLGPEIDWNKVMNRNRLDVLLYERCMSENLVGRNLKSR